MSRIKSDEKVVLFPSDARLEANDWVATVHGWIFEPEANDLLRNIAVRSLMSGFDLAHTTLPSDLFEERLRWFLVDNERRKRVVVLVGERRFPLEASHANGHFSGTVRIPRDEAARLAQSGRLTYRAIVQDGDAREFSGEILLIGNEGISVISDIDDTIKVSEVRDRQKLLENTFFKPFHPVDAMAATYRRWSEQGAQFHYLSNAPWQLYDSLSSFLRDTPYPAGTVELREFRIRDGSFLAFLLDNPMQAKLPRIERLLSRYPGRRFVLVGDSGEKDPETYADVARRHPDQVLRIMRRDVTNENRTAERYLDTFRQVPEEKWLIFTQPDALSL